MNPFQYLAQTVKMMLLGALILSCVFVLNQFKLSRCFPIKMVNVYGVNHIAHQEVKVLLLPLVNNGFFAVNVEYIRERLLQMPWVSDIFVERRWPDKVDITVVEKNAIARWNQQSLLSDAGEVFSAKQETYPSSLPRFVGPDGKQMVMLHYFNEMNRLLTPLHAKISYLELTPYFTWQMSLNNGMTLQIGHKDILTRLDQFVKVYPKIVGNRMADVEYVDLRYPNGIAIRWKVVIKT